MGRSNTNRTEQAGGWWLVAGGPMELALPSMCGCGCASFPDQRISLCVNGTKPYIYMPVWACQDFMNEMIDSWIAKSLNNEKLSIFVGALGVHWSNRSSIASKPIITIGKIIIIIIIMIFGPSHNVATMEI